MARQLTPMDSSFLYNDTRNTPQTIGSVTIYDPSTARNGFVRFKDILRAYEIRLDRSPTFTRKVMRVPMALDQPYWIEDENFDLEYHVRHVALPKPGDWRQLCILVARLNSHPLDLDRPLWQSWIIEGLDNIEGIPEGCFAHMIRFHHAAFDGMAAADFGFAIHDAEPIFPEGEYGTDLKKRRAADKPGLPEMAARAYTNSVKTQWNLAKLAAKAPGQITKGKKYRAENNLDNTPKKPVTRFDAPVSPNRVYGALEFPFSQFKDIRTAMPGTTINDVAMAVFSRALRKYLGDKNELPQQSLLAALPVSLRTQEAVNDQANDVSSMFLPIHTNIEDPVEALQAIHETIAKHKAQRLEVGEPMFVQMMASMPAIAQSGMGRMMGPSSKMGLQFSPVNTAVSNVPGTRVPMYFAGAKGVKAHGVGILMHGAGLSNVVSSYLDNVTISFISCRDMMPDPQNYEAGIRDGFKEIYEATTGKAYDAVPAKPAAKSASKAARKPARKTAAKKAPARQTTGTKATAKKPAAKKKPARRKKKAT